LINIGMGIYNGVWEHLYRRYVQGEKGANENASLLPDYTDAMATSVPSTNGPPRGGVYFDSDKDSLNRE